MLRQPKKNLVFNEKYKAFPYPNTVFCVFILKSTEPTNNLFQHTTIYEESKELCRNQSYEVCWTKTKSGTKRLFSQSIDTIIPSANDFLITSKWGAKYIVIH